MSALIRNLFSAAKIVWSELAQLCLYCATACSADKTSKTLQCLCLKASSYGSKIFEAIPDVLMGNFHKFLFSTCKEIQSFLVVTQKKVLKNDTQICESHFKGCYSFHNILRVGIFCSVMHWMGSQQSWLLTFHLSELLSPPTSSLLGANNLP